MKAGWEVKPLGEVCDVLDRLRKPITKKDRTRGPYPYYGATGVLDHVDGFLFDEPLVLIGEDGAKWDAGDNSAFAVTGKVWVNNHAHVIRPDRSRLSDKWLIYFLNFSDLSAFITGMTVPKLNQAKMREIPIPIPPLEEQRRIVAVLDAAFEGLTRAKQHAEANLQNARELFEAALIAVFGEFDNEANQKLLKEISLDFGRGKSKHRPRNDPSLYGGSYPFVQTGDVRNSPHLNTTYKQTYSEKGLAQSKLWPTDTLCITIAANIAETAILSFDACFPDSIIGVVPDPAVTSSRYLEYLLQFFQKRLKARGEGAAQHNINLATFETEYFPFPSLDNQERAIDALDIAARAVQSAETNYQSKLQDIADLRQSLLQKAFSGALT